MEIIKIFKKSSIKFVVELFYLIRIHVSVVSITQNSFCSHYDEFVGYINLVLTFYYMIEANNIDSNMPKDDTPQFPPKDGGYKKVRF